MKRQFNVFDEEPVDPGFPTRVLAVGGIAVGMACGLLLYSGSVAAAISRICVVRPPVRSPKAIP